MAVRLAGPLRHLAAGAPVPEFVARGLGAGLAPVELAAGAGIDPVLSPRLATVLLAVGRFPGELGGALARPASSSPQRPSWPATPPGRVAARPGRAGGGDSPRARSGTDVVQHCSTDPDRGGRTWPP